jgi:hypothetical protein
MKKALLILLSCFIIIPASAQKSYIKKRWNIKAGYSKYETDIFKLWKPQGTGNFQVECNYGISKFIEIGSFLGVNRFFGYKTIVPNADTLNLILNTPDKHFQIFTPSIGLNLNFHILPFLIIQDNFRFDLYITAKYSGFYFSTPESYYPKKGYFNEFGLGGGLAFYLLKHTGLYIEYSYGKFIYNDHSKIRYGLSFKF